MIEHNIEELHAAVDETAEEAERIKEQFHSRVEIQDHWRWGCFGDGFTPINYVPRLASVVGERA